MVSISNSRKRRNNFPTFFLSSEFCSVKILFSRSRLTEDPAGWYRQMERLSPSKNPCDNSGTSEPAMSPVVPHFPRPPNFGGHNSEKCGTGPELLDDRRRERMRSYTAMLRRTIAEGRWFRTRRVPAGGYVCKLPGNVTDKEEFYRALNLLKPVRPPSFAQMMITELPEINNVNRVQGNNSKRPGSWSSWL